MTKVAVFVRDFEMGTRIADVAVALGKEPVFPADLPPADQVLPRDTFMVILDLSDKEYWPLELVRTIRRENPELPIVGFVSQVQKQFHSEARDAGCNWVLPRSSLIQNLPTLIEKGGPDLV